MCTVSGGSTGRVVVGLDTCCGRLTHFQVIQGLLDRTMQLLEVPLSTSQGDDGGYYLKASDGEWRECGSGWMCTLWVCSMCVCMCVYVCVCVCVCCLCCVCAVLVRA